MLSYRQYGQEAPFIIVPMHGVKVMHGNGHDLFLTSLEPFCGVKATGRIRLSVCSQ